jgi:hypothetical protein
MEDKRFSNKHFSNNFFPRKKSSFASRKNSQRRPRTEHNLIIKAEFEFEKIRLGGKKQQNF